MALAASTVACTHQHAYPATIPELAKADSVVLTSGETLEADSMGYAQDGSIVLMKSGRQDVVYPNQIQEVRAVSHGRGLLEGFGIGALVGAGTGALTGLASGDDTDEESFIQFSAGEKALIIGFAFGVVGAGTGAVIGLIAGSKDVYSYQSPQIQVVPTQGGGQVSLGFDF